jgi:ethanolamine ammonia-lyase large subunit
MERGMKKHSINISSPKTGEDIFSYIERTNNNQNETIYRQIVGSANPFKEGDKTIGVAALNDLSRMNSRTLLSNTKVIDIHNNPLFVDDIQKLINETTDESKLNILKDWTLDELKIFILTKSEDNIKAIMPGLSSDVIGCLIKIMNNDELIIVGQKVFNPLPGSKIGAKGYMGARVQPNSPTDNIDDIMWQVFCGWSYAVGDVVLGTNPVSSTVEAVAKIETILTDIIKTFGLETIIPNCVLAHIDVQAAVEKCHPGTTGIWFQSLAGTVNANQTFDLTIDKMFAHASKRKGQYGLYGETGQGADFTNGHGSGFDMVVHESRKYGFLRALKMRVAQAQVKEVYSGPWVHVNDVAGFIGPEIFKSREQLVRCCLEDTVMGKLHGLTIGLDICSTLHMDINLDDLEWCIEQIMPVNPAYLMALPTKNDPMLSYLTTAYNDHVKVRSKFGYKVNDAMWEFFKRIKIIGKNGKVTEHFGDPVWVYYQFRLAKNDNRAKEAIYKEGRKLISQVRKRGVPIAESYGTNIWDMEPSLDKKVRVLYEDAKLSLWTEMTNSFITSIPNFVSIKTTSDNRKDYVYHPESGEKLTDDSINTLLKLHNKWNQNSPDVQIIISDGLNALAIMDEGHLIPYLELLRVELTSSGFKVFDDNIVITNGRVRAGYRCGEFLFGNDIGITQAKGIVHIIGERPGSGHHNFSAYLSTPKIRTWNEKGKLDHNISKVVSGISDTALIPDIAAKNTVSIFSEMFNEVGASLVSK